MSERKSNTLYRSWSPLFRWMDGDVINVIIPTEPLHVVKVHNLGDAGVGQKPMCKSTEEIEKLREEANEPE